MAVLACPSSGPHGVTRPQPAGFRPKAPRPSTPSTAQRSTSRSRPPSRTRVTRRADAASTSPAAARSTAWPRYSARAGAVRGASARSVPATAQVAIIGDLSAAARRATRQLRARANDRAGVENDPKPERAKRRRQCRSGGNKQDETRRDRRGWRRRCDRTAGEHLDARTIATEE